MLPESTPEDTAAATPLSEPATPPVAVAATEPAEAAEPDTAASEAASTEAVEVAAAALAEPADAANADAAEAAAVAAGEAEAAGDAPADIGPAATPPPPDLPPAACAARLAELFPALFGADRALPVKLRIQADIQQRAPGLFNRRTLSVFLHRHTTSNAYLRAMVQATQRHDLDGQPAGELSDEHRTAATAELERRRAIVEARRAAEREAQREARHLAARSAAPRREPGPPPSPEEIERRERAQLLRAFETSTLTRANFCTLKGLDEATLEARLAQARQERAERPPQIDPRADPRGPRPEGGRPPRRDGAPRRRRHGQPQGPREA
ncbi:ProP effector ProQ [Rubrivivax sp. A210]|nr:ProP effector ProQ [Rubrivivax sp. A210]